MAEKRTITIKMDEAEVSFQMLLDTSSVADAATKYFIDNIGACEPEVCHLMARVIRSGGTVRDGGANIGFFTLFMSRLVSTTGKVLAFEPAPQNLAKLRDNIGLNGMRNVTVDSRPLWSLNEDVELWMG